MDTPPVVDTPSSAEDYRVRLDIFEGPMDLLLHLIKLNEMEIHEVSISNITQQYLSYLRLMEQLDLEVAGDFLVMASTLINIKLRSLLPETHEEEDEEEQADDFMTAQALMDKLVEYRKFKEAAAALREQESAQANTFVREVALPKLTDADSDEELQMELDALMSAFSRVLRFVERRDWHLVTEEEYSVEEKMDWLEQRLLLEEQLDAEELFKACRTKLEAIVILLAALELCHLRRVCVAQSETYGSILIYPQNEGPQPVEETGDPEAQFEPWPEPLPPEEPELEAAVEDHDTHEGEIEAGDESPSADIVDISPDEGSADELTGPGNDSPGRDE